MLDRVILVLFAFKLLAGCSEAPLEKRMVLLDTFTLNTATVDTSFMRVSNYKFLYVGKEEDTLHVNYEFYRTCIIPPPPPPPELYQEYAHSYAKAMGRIKQAVPYFSSHYFKSDTAADRYMTSDDEVVQRFIHRDTVAIELFVDTTQVIANILDDWDLWVSDAYPVVLKNRIADTVTVGYGAHLPILLEAKDSTNTWKQVEYNYRYRCGVGLTSCLLPPGELIVTSVPIHSGNYKTKFRLRYLGTVFSNEFDGEVNYNLFKSQRYEKW